MTRSFLPWRWRKKTEKARMSLPWRRKKTVEKERKPEVKRKKGKARRTWVLFPDTAPRNRAHKLKERAHRRSKAKGVRMSRRKNRR